MDRQMNRQMDLLTDRETDIEETQANTLKGIEKRKIIQQYLLFILSVPRAKRPPLIDIIRIVKDPIMIPKARIKYLILTLSLILCQKHFFFIDDASGK